MYHVFAAEDGMMVSRANSRRKASCDYGAANTEGGRRNGLEEGDGGGCHSSKLPACSLDVRWQSDKVRGWIVSDFGPVDAAGLPASKAVRCEGVVEQSDPETRYTRRQGGPAVSGHTYIHYITLLQCSSTNLISFGHLYKFLFI